MTSLESDLANFGEVGLVDRLGRAGVARGDKVRLPILPWLPCPGAPEARGRCNCFPELCLEMLRGSVTGVVGDVHVPAEFTGYSTRMGGVAVESTRTAV